MVLVSVVLSSEEEEEEEGGPKRTSQKIQVGDTPEEELWFLTWGPPPLPRPQQTQFSCQEPHRVWVWVSGPRAGLISVLVVNEVRSDGN